jgi:hypothetical protein
MTTVKEFRKNTRLELTSRVLIILIIGANIMASLRKLDTILPAGSHVVTVGLGDGLALWDAMHARLHPIGVTYVCCFFSLNAIRLTFVLLF